MLRRPRRLATAAPALVLAAWTTACYTARPYEPPTASTPVPGGVRHDRVRVDFAHATRLHLQTAAGDTGSSTASHVTGTVVEVRGDTVVLRAPEVDGTRMSFNPPGRTALTAATVLVTPDEEARYTTRHFSLKRTALLGLGAAAVLGAVAAANASASSKGSTTGGRTPQADRR